MYQILSNLSKKYGVDCASKVCKRYMHLSMPFGPIIAKQGPGGFADADRKHWQTVDPCATSELEMNCHIVLLTLVIGFFLIH